MPPVRPKLSITLPRNFTFHFTDGQGPKTPEDKSEGVLPQPSPPRPYRLRTRRRGGLCSFDPPSDQITSFGPLPQDVPIPTIELPDTPIDSSTPIDAPSTSDIIEGLLAPMPSRTRYVSSPKTPAAQIFPTIDAPLYNDLGGALRGESDLEDSIRRPESACSTFSDSSDASSDSSTSFPSTGGSCTSPESDAPDPFGSMRVDKGKRKVTSLIPVDSQPVQASRHAKHANWTSDMDTHLWRTYHLYREDPTMTPFRSTFGTAPPLGVCCRIARTARRTWRGPLVSLREPKEVQIPEAQEKLRDVNDEVNAVPAIGSPDTLKGSRSGSATPTGPSESEKVVFSRWPSSDAATRRRLRFLCKRNPTVSNHRYRLMQSRSPTPLIHHSRRRRAASPMHDVRHGPSFSTWDINYSLTTSTAASMRPDGALARLARSTSQQQQQQQQQHLLQNDLQSLQPVQGEIFGGYGQSSLPSRVGLGIGGLDSSNTFPRLGSPFAARPRPSILNHSYLRPSSALHTQSDHTAMLPSMLRSPFAASGPAPIFPLKRRAHHIPEEDMESREQERRSSVMEEIFGAPLDNSHRRVRSRGFSLGDVSEGSRIASIATPPTRQDQLVTSDFVCVTQDYVPIGGAPTVAGSSETNRLLRLGSPFGGAMEESGSHERVGLPSETAQRQDRHEISISNARTPRDIESSIDQRLGILSDDETWRSKRMRG